MKIKAYFEIYPWTDQSNIFFFGSIPTTPKGDNCKRYVAEIDVADPDADFEKTDIVGVEEI